MPVTVAVAIPCYNEAPTIAKVVRDFRNVLPHASIYVFDNNSTDGTGKIAKDAGASVYLVRKRGKGVVMRAIFDMVAADTMIIVDGDDTYSAEDAPMLLEPVLRGEADMVIGNRLQNASDKSLLKVRKLGNNLFTNVANFIFGATYQDVLSGYRVFSRRFVETVPLLTSGFEVEIELNIRALEEGWQVVELPIAYRSRPASSSSKLKVFSDGYRIMLELAILFVGYHPFPVYSVIGGIFIVIALIAALLRFVNCFWLTPIPNMLLLAIILLFIATGIITMVIGLTLSAIDIKFYEIKQYINRKYKA